MEYYKSPELYSGSAPSAVTIGKFDGMHRGHMKLFERIAEKKKDGLKSIVLIVGKDGGEYLTPLEEQREFLERLNIDALIRCPLTDAFASMTPEAFTADILSGLLKASYVAVGDDFRFGFARTGNASFLKSCRASLGFETDVVEKEKYLGRDINSTRIRNDLLEGRMEYVSDMLGRSYSIASVTEPGRHLGRKMGFPTANIRAPHEKLLPPDGVYACRAVLDGSSYEGVVNVGRRPTVGGHTKKLEAHLFAELGDEYNKRMKLELIRFIRSERRFSSLEELEKQIRLDIEKGKEILKEKTEGI